MVSSASASGPITIKDSSGNVRGEANVEIEGRIEFQVSGESGAPSTGAEITLTDPTTGVTFSAFSSEGVVVFESIPPGVYVVSSTDLSLTFTSVALSESSAALGVGSSVGGGLITGEAVAGILGVGALAGGTYAVVDAQNNDKKDPPLSSFE